MIVPELARVEQHNEQLAAAGSPARVHVQALDGLRGIAAISVMLHHAVLGNSHGHLAVDFFFCLSGFVIALAYEKHLLAGLPVARYLRWRILRVYPLLLIGGLLGFALWRYNPDAGFLANATRAELLAPLLAHVFLIPFIGSKYLFIFNNAHWSILYELGANALHAVFARALTNRLVGAVIVLSGMYLIFGVARAGTIHLGWDNGQIDMGLARTLFSFFAGILIFRRRQFLEAMLPQFGFWWLAAALLVAASVPSLAGLGGWVEVTRQLATAMVLNPLVVCLALNTKAESKVVRGLGVLSFPLYAIHLPLVFLGAAILTPHFAGLNLKLAMLAWCAAIIVPALLLGYYVDLPLNRLRRRWLEGRQPAPAPAAPAPAQPLPPITKILPDRS